MSKWASWAVEQVPDPPGSSDLNSSAHKGGFQLTFATCGGSQASCVFIGAYPASEGRELGEAYSYLKERRMHSERRNKTHIQTRIKTCEDGAIPWRYLFFFLTYKRFKVSLGAKSNWKQPLSDGGSDCSPLADGIESLRARAHCTIVRKQLPWNLCTHPSASAVDLWFHEIAFFFLTGQSDPRAAQQHIESHIGLLDVIRIH